MRRITFVTAQLRGYDRVGGAGTATTFVAVALARAGHEVNVLYAGPAGRPLDPEWASVYSDAGVRVETILGPPRRVEPPRFARIRAVERALRDAAPEVVIGHDFGAPLLSALRLRQLGLGFDGVLFVVFCHGTRTWVKEVNRNPRVSADVLAENLLERTAGELADVVVSPSGFMIDWMRAQGWRLPESTYVIPYFTPSAATGATPPSVASGQSGRVRRLAFFGRLDERKGLTPFLSGMNRVSPQLLSGVELEFVGAPTKEWTPERILHTLDPVVRGALADVSFQTDLDQQEALARLGRAGTLAVMPSISDNSPNTIYECIERGIPFIASSVGGTPELVAPDDHARALFEPTPASVAAALERTLASDDALRPVTPAFDGASSLERWSEVVARRPVVVDRTRAEPSDGAAPWVVLLEEDDVPRPELVERLFTAQRATGADVVTCAIEHRSEDGAVEHFFAGEPAGIGLVENGYGTAALVRRALLEPVGDGRNGDRDAAWPLLARLAADGASIVSIPLPLVERKQAPGDIARTPRDALEVIETMERRLPRALAATARLAAGLAADARRPGTSR